MRLILKPKGEELSIDELDFSEAKIKQLKRKKIETISELLNLLPREYFDYRKTLTVKEIKKLEEGTRVAFRGMLKNVLDKSPKFINLTFLDKNSEEITVVYFGNQRWILNTLYRGTEYLVCGDVRRNKWTKRMQIVSPVKLTVPSFKTMKITPRYVKVPGMSEDYLESIMTSAIEYADMYMDFDNRVRLEFNIPSIKESLYNTHFPRSFEDVKTLERRLVFEVLFKFLWMKKKKEKSKSNLNCVNISTDEFIKKIPFKLTNDQLNVIKSIEEKIKKGITSPSLVEGDVGSGKTIVAFSLMYAVAKAGYQSVMLAPTQTLAHQHYLDALKYFGSDVNVRFLTGSTKKKEEKEILKGLQNGDIDVLIGTTSVINKGYKNLLLKIVDEEHRFGVRDREKLNEKYRNTHSINLTATPIPRSLALATEGEGTDIYLIKAMPNGRKPVETHVEVNKLKIMEKMIKEVLKGHQAYVVCPLIEEGKLDAKNVMDTAKQMQGFLKKAGFLNIKVDYITGDMKQSEIDEKVNAFKENKFQILVSTTIIEVGVNIENATFMLILSADRFGLATLHQLRGRVGRNSFQSYCYLYSNTPEKERLKILEKTHSGFEIAKRDLELRGPGELFGLKQSGENEELLIIIKYPELLERISNYIDKEIITNEKRRKNLEDFLENA